MARRRSPGAVAVAAVVLSVLGGCASQPDDEGSADPASTPAEPTTSPDDQPTAEETAGDAVLVQITISGDQVSPNGERVRVGVDEIVRLVIDADSAGELHLHSTPEQQVAYAAGKSTHEVTFDKPGVVEVESHDVHAVIVQLEVR